MADRAALHGPGRMRPQRRSRTTALAIVLLAATAALCMALGRWQLRRADERIALTQTIAAGRQAAPVVLNAGQGAHPLQEWQPAQAAGRWLERYSVLLDNRNLHGRPGLWLATPLLLDGGQGKVAVLVLRGWLPRPVNFSPDADVDAVSVNAYAPLPVAAAEIPPVHELVRGHVRNHVPRLYELWQRGGRDASALPGDWSARPPVVQNLALDRYAQSTGLTLLPVVLVQENTTLPENLVREWEPPSLDADKNRGYALQWFSFATIAAIAALGLIWRTLAGKLRNRPRPRSE